jgi:hypothetical protein
MGKYQSGKMQVTIEKISKIFKMGIDICDRL